MYFKINENKEKQKKIGNQQMSRYVYFTHSIVVINDTED